MHIFRLLVTAGPGHPIYSVGLQLEAICMVASSDAEEAHLAATNRLAELGWASVALRDTILLPPNPDISGLNQVMRDAFQEAGDSGVSLIVYPEPAGAA
jgi:hypothetical protein